MAERKTCFVIMPFGKKKDDEGHEIDFDVIYDDIIKEPVKQAGLECIRCDDIEEAGSIHEDMFAQIATADVAVVDITNLNPNVFYELGARHALKDCVTVLIRKRGGAIPFNIQDMRIIEYPSETGRYSESREKIQHFIENGLKSSDADSPIYQVLERLRAEDDASRRIEEREELPYRLKDRHEKQIEIRTGDIRKWPGVDVWVNSENTNMQMARFYDRNLSAVIRYYGAKKDENDEIVEDTIANELAGAIGDREFVPLGTVFATSAGALEGTHGVKKIFHVASVTGVPGEGYRAMPALIDTCVNRCLRRMDSDNMKEAELKTIAFPMIGTGAGGGDVHNVAKVMIGTAVEYLKQHPDSVIEMVVFMAWNRKDLEACTAAISEITDVERVA